MGNLPVVVTNERVVASATKVVGGYEVRVFFIRVRWWDEAKVVGAIYGLGTGTVPVGAGSTVNLSLYGGEVTEVVGRIWVRSRYTRGSRLGVAITREDATR